MSNGDFKLAYKLKVNDSIISFDYMTYKHVEDKITSITIEMVQGFAAPVTAEGTLLTDGLLLSCYAMIENHKVAHFVMSPVRWLFSFNKVYENLLPSYVTRLIRIDKQSSGIHWYFFKIHLIYSNNLNL
jgi:hypothetical protein